MNNYLLLVATLLAIVLVYLCYFPSKGPEGTPGATTVAPSGTTIASRATTAPPSGTPFSGYLQLLSGLQSFPSQINYTINSTDTMDKITFICRSSNNIEVLGSPAINKYNNNSLNGSVSFTGDSNLTHPYSIIAKMEKSGSLYTGSITNTTIQLGTITTSTPFPTFINYGTKLIIDAINDRNFVYPIGSTRNITYLSMFGNKWPLITTSTVIPNPLPISLLPTPIPTQQVISSNFTLDRDLKQFNANFSYKVEINKTNIEIKKITFVKNFSISLNSFNITKPNSDSILADNAKNIINNAQPNSLITLEEANNGISGTNNKMSNLLPGREFNLFWSFTINNATTIPSGSEFKDFEIYGIFS